MRDLILLRGAPGAGKSTFASAQGLTPHVVSPDDFRLRLGGVTMSEEGALGVDHGHEKRVWAEIEETLAFKMSRGQLVVVDATFQRSRDFTMPLALAKRHRYRAICIDFSSVPKDLALARNLSRPAWKVVPETVIHTAYERYAANPPPRGVEVWPFHALDAPGAVLDRLEPPLLDLSDYAAVIHVGDIHGCLDPLLELYPEGPAADRFHVFIGDLLDRGPRNGEVIRWAMTHIAGRENVALLWGNHETHLHRFALGEPSTSAEFAQETLPQLEAVGFTPEEAGRLMDGARDALRYVWRGRRVLATHGGLPRLPERLAPLPSELFWKGAGAYAAPVDQRFAETMNGSGWLQVHGHRNKQELPIEAAPGSFNLEGKVEFGGDLRAMRLTEAGAEPIAIRNRVFRDPAREPAKPRAAGGSGEGGRISAETLAKLEAHPLVRAKSFRAKPHIKSYNFTAKAFFDGRWDEVNMVARGLFVDSDRRVVARSYPKFFNLDERPETRRKSLQATLAFPLRLWVKENGFLGVLGWDHAAEEPLFCSKSTLEGGFAGWFREIAEAELGERGLTRAATLLRERNLSLVFEVNDPIRDPHMISYDAPHVVLLDAIHRQEKFERLDHDALREIAETLGLRVKQPGPSFREWREFEGWLRSVEAAGRHFRWKERHVEGFVAEAADGFQFKLKLAFYAFWRRMRALRNQIRRAREKGRPVSMALEDPEAAAFRDWLMAKPDAWLTRDIIGLRRDFQAETGGGET